MSTVGWLETCDTPWPHKIITGMLAPVDYHAVIQHLPPLVEMRPLGKSTTRYLYWLVEDGVVSPDLPPFWYAFVKFPLQALRISIETLFGVKGSYIGAELVYDKPGYSLGPHTDRPERLITTVTYLHQVGPKLSQQLGTVLYSNPTPDPLGKGHKLTSDFVKAKVIPYAPNTALCFERTDNSYHGVEPIPTERWSLAIDIFK